jgi:hypothetical protein
MRAIFWACIIALAIPTAYAQAVQTPSAVPTADGLPTNGEIDDASVLDVVVMTKSDIGPFIRFLIQIPDPAKTWYDYDPAKRYWFYVRNDDNAKALERGAIIGLLMGAAETHAWSSEQVGINFTYSTINGRREIETASLASKILH